MQCIINNKKTITFPVGVNKVPIVKNWNKLSEKHPQQQHINIGALTGKVNNFMVIDCDILKSEDPDKFISGVDVWSDITSYIPCELKCPSVQTPSGGLHIYFQYNDKIKSSVQKFKVNQIIPEEVDDERIVKIDIISDNKFIICPPSTGYTWLNDSHNLEPPPMPQCIIDIFTPTNNNIATKYTSTTYQNITHSTLQQVVDNIPSCLSDNRDDWIKIIWAIADTAQKNNYDAIDIADKFSQSSKKYKDIDDVVKIYKQSNGQVGFGSLLYHSTYKLPKEEKTIELTNVYKDTFINDINNNLPLDIKEIVNITDDQDKKICELITIEGEKINVTVHTKNIAATKDDVFLGYLQKLLNIKYDLSVIHPQFKDNCEVIFMDQHTIDFVYRDANSGEHRIRVKHPWENSKRYFTKYSHGKQLGCMRRNKQELAVIIDEALKNACVSHMTDKYNMTVNINIQNNYFGTNDDVIRSDEELIKELMKSHPGIVDNFKFCDNTNMSGIYLYGPNTGIWRKEHNGTIEKMLSSRLRNYVPMLTEKEIKYIGTNKNIQQLRQMFVKEIIDQDFDKKIDENLNIFACSNGVYDIELKQFRRSIPHDFVFTNSGWDYSEADADLYIDEVVDFFNKLFPIAEEYNVVMTYIASLIHGYRQDKKFLALTDKRNGNNGKSTLISLLRRFFGDYIKTSNKFLLKGAFDKDKDSHDGGLEPLKGKRLLVCDELKKNMRLDEGLIKNLAGGEYMVEGRRLGKATQFKFMWQAGIIMIFNEGDCPKFDCTDNAFMERLVIVPMRSKFTVKDEDPDTFTFKRDAEITTKFNKWRSSLLKLFMQYTPDTKGLTKTNIPTSMTDWKSEIINENNELNDWLFSVVKEDKEGFVQLNELKEKYKKDFPHEKNIKSKDLDRMINCLFNNKGVYVKEQISVKIDGQRKFKRNVYSGYNYNY